MEDSIFDHFPIIGTIRRFVSYWAGGEVFDYNSCAVTEHKCVGLGKTIAKIQCQKCIDQLRDKYLLELPSPSIVKGVLEALGMGVTGTAGWKIMFAAGATEGAKALGKFLIGLGIVFAIDMIADLWLYFYRKGKIEEAAIAAKLKWCICDNYENMPE
jgi:hypothetical protein